MSSSISFPVRVQIDQHGELGRFVDRGDESVRFEVEGRGGGELISRWGDGGVVGRWELFALVKLAE